MAITKEKKAKSLDAMKEIFKKAKSMAFVNFHGITVKDVNEFRRKLQESEVGYKVGKKTLIRLALKDLGLEGEMPNLEGEVCVAYGSDDLAPAREVQEFGKQKAGIVKILGGIFEGKFMNMAEMIEIASIPSREVLLSKIAYLLKSPMQRLAIGVSEVAKTRV